MNYTQCKDCVCSTCANTACAGSECSLCDKLTVGLEVPRGYPNTKCPNYIRRQDFATKCLCCGADVPFGSVYCPNCLVTQIRC